MKKFAYLKRISPKGLKRFVVMLLSIPYYVAFRLKKKNIYLRWNSSDINVFYHTFVEKEFSLPFQLNDIKFIIDAGANTGLTSILFTDHFPDAKIIAIEPEQNNFEMLKKNVNAYQNVIPLKNGVWCSDTYLKISNPDGQSWSFTTEEVNENADYDIEAISISTIMKKYNASKIDLLKVDIEGAEKELFSKNTASWMPFTRYIVIEIHGNECMDITQAEMKKYGMKHIHTNGENFYYENSNILN